MTAEAGVTMPLEATASCISRGGRQFWRADDTLWACAAPANPHKAMIGQTRRMRRACPFRTERSLNVTLIQDPRRGQDTEQCGRDETRGGDQLDCGFGESARVQGGSVEP